MTFYEAALQILTKEGRPLHAREITEIALRDNLLSHVGKQPEQTMASRLAAMARRSHDRRLVAVEPDTFGLVEWNLPASPEALEESGLPERHDETEPPLRGRERHPRISKENVRIAGRGERRRREEVERKKKRLPPLAELVYELLDRVGRPAPLFDLVASARERELLGEDIGSEAVETVLREENERREADGKKTVFEFHDGGFVGLRGRHGAPEVGFDILSAVAEAARNLALEKKAKAAPAPVPAGPAPLRGPVAQAVAEQRQRAVKQLRRRLAELDGPGIEAVTALVLESMGYREVRVAKRGKEGALFVGKRRMGLVELRSCIRAIRAGRDLRREDVLELRKEMAAHGAHLAVLLSPADVGREARAEAVQPGAPVVLLLCGEALADQLVEKGIGVTSRTVTVVEFDENAFGQLLPKREEKPAEEKRGGEESKERREEERRRGREERREERRRAREERRAARAAARAAAAEAGAGTAPAEMPGPTDTGAEVAATAGESGAGATPAEVPGPMDTGAEPTPAAGEGREVEAVPTVETVPEPTGALPAPEAGPLPEPATPVAPVSPPDEPPPASGTAGPESPAASSAAATEPLPMVGPAASAPVTVPAGKPSAPESVGPEVAAPTPGTPDAPPPAATEPPSPAPAVHDAPAPPASAPAAPAAEASPPAPVGTEPPPVTPPAEEAPAGAAAAVPAEAAPVAPEPGVEPGPRDRDDEPRG